MNRELKSVLEKFRIDGDFVTASPHGCGHINDTFATVVNERGREVRYIFQRINQNVFKAISKKSFGAKNLSPGLQHLRIAEFF